MSELEVHRAIVHSSDPTTGKARVYIPEILGAAQTIEMPTVGLTNSDGFWNVPSPGSSVFVAATSDRTHFLWLTTIGTAGSGGDSPSNEPIGHEDRTDSLIAFDNATRTFSIQPVSTSYVVWCVGLRYEKTSLESIQIPNTTGLYYISFNAQGQLQYSTTYFVWDQDCPTSYVYWNSATQRAEFFADERHGITMDWQTHEYLHRTRGAAIANGFDASNFDTSTQNGNTDAQAKLDIDNGTFFDEDLQVDVRHSLAPAQNTWEQQLQGPARIPVFYRSGTSYVYDAPTDFPVKQGTTHPLYNSSSGGNWSTTELGANKYGIQWIVATNQLNYPILSIMGQTQYDNVGQAEAASWADMDLDGLPIVEIRVLYKVIFRATGSNTPGCYFEQIDDYRTALSNATSTAAAVVDHGNLTGLADDDHPQYLTEARGDARYYTESESNSLFATSGHTHSYLQLSGGTLTGHVTHGYNIASPTNYYNGLQLEVQATSGTAGIGLHRSGYSHVGIYHDATNVLKFNMNSGTVTLNYNTGTIWGSGNDGSGSGLDADTLDGSHASAFAASSHSHSYYATGSSVRALYYNGYGNSEITAYQTSGNWQTWTGGWATHIICNHGDGSNYYNQTIIMPFWGVPAYMRKTGGSNSSVYTFWSTENANNNLTDSSSSSCLSAVSGTINTAGPDTTSTSGYQYVLRNNTYGTLYRFSSNRSLKDKIQPIEDVGSVIDSLVPVSFIPRFVPREEGETETEEQRILRENDVQYGFIAEDIGAVDEGHLAQWEWTDTDLVPVGWKWSDMIAVLTAEVKNLRSRIAALETGT